jgi:hypothetical protein
MINRIYVNFQLKIQPKKKKMIIFLIFLCFKLFYIFLLYKIEKKY